MICFLLQGATTDEAPTTLMAYMLSDFYKDGVLLDFPGRTKSIVDALIRGVTKHGGEVRLKSPVASVSVKDGAAAGVVLEDGTAVAADVVVSNADLWTTRKLVASTAHAPLLEYLDGQAARWAALDDWDAGVGAPRNLVLVSVASLLDASLAPDGCHAIHAYVPGDGALRGLGGVRESGGYQSKAYRAAKEEAVEVLWKAIERHPGPHGPRDALDNFYVCGDSTFPGIGMPAVAAGMITAASIPAP
ncbi:all-trans-retinol 13,14-reductase [Aureococcus anophagefferens]|nr:all-trans-retinol 13,14-reductase [Aureococcus anophagefferens]